MENVKLNQPLQNLCLDYQLKLEGAIEFWDEESGHKSIYAKGVKKGLKKARQLFIETIKEMEIKYDETL